MDETTPRGFFLLWLCPDTMDLETVKGREARNEVIRLVGECYRTPDPRRGVMTLDDSD
jgi:hypothetical protein